MAGKLHGATSAFAVLCATMIPAAAVAQSAPTDRIDAIEKQIRNLQGELQNLKKELGEAKQQLQQSRSETQRSKEEARQARQAAEQARHDALKAVTAESQAAQAAAQAQAALAAPPPTPSIAAKGIEVGFPGGRPTISTSDGKNIFRDRESDAVRLWYLLPKPKPEYAVSGTQQRRQFAPRADILCRKVRRFNAKR